MLIAVAVAAAVADGEVGRGGLGGGVSLFVFEFEGRRENEDPLMAGRRLVRREVRDSSGTWDIFTVLPLTMQPNASTSCWTGRWSRSHSWMTCSIGGAGDGNCVSWQ